jgi:hypothetical protein
MKEITNTQALDHAAGIFLNGINTILEEQVSRAKESLYAKRWWTKGLSALRSRFTNKRNRVISLRRRGEDTT